MSIRLDKAPSYDGIGCKRWTYPLRHDCVLHVFERPRYALPCDTDPPFMIRLTRDGATVTAFATTKRDAAAMARLIADMD